LLFAYPYFINQFHFGPYAMRVTFINTRPEVRTQADREDWAVVKQNPFLNEPHSVSDQMRYVIFLNLQV